MSRIAILVDEMFEEHELRVPCRRFKEAGHEVEVLGLESGREVKGKGGVEKVTIEKAVAEANPDDYDALVIPGGYSPDHLRTDRAAVRFTSMMAAAGKPVAAVCHAPSLLIEANLVEDRTVTSWPSIKTDLINAGAKWVDREVVVDENVITSRKPADLPAFADAVIEMLERGSADHAPVLAPAAPVHH
jgi:protease I